MKWHVRPSSLSKTRNEIKPEVTMLGRLLFLGRGVRGLVILREETNVISSFRGFGLQ